MSFVAHLIKHININLLKSMGAAELVDLMMNFVIYPCLIIVHAIVQKSVVYIFLIQPVDNLNKIFILNHIQRYSSIRKGKNQHQQLRNVLLMQST